MTIQEAIKARTAPFKQRYANFIGDLLSNQRPSTGSTQRPPMKLA